MVAEWHYVLKDGLALTANCWRTTAGGGSVSCLQMLWGQLVVHCVDQDTEPDGPLV